MPYYPQFNKNPIDVVKEAEANGAKTDEEIIKYTVEQLKVTETCNLQSMIRMLKKIFRGCGISGAAMQFMEA